MAELTLKKHINRTKTDTAFDLIVLLFMVIFLIICVYPLYFIVIASISDPMLVGTGKVILIPKGVGLDGYRRIFSEPKIWTGYYNTILYTVVGTAVSLVMTLTAGYSLSRKDLRGRKTLLFLLVFTMFFSGGMIPTYMVVNGLGMINTFWSMIFPSAVSVWNLLITRSFFETTIPDELLDAAMIDGCGNLRFFVRMVLPLSQAIVAVMILFYAIAQWNAFFSALIYLESERLYPLQLILRNILIANQVQQSMVEDVADLMARQRLAEQLKYGIIVVASIPVLLLYPFVQKYFVTGIMVGSIKG